MRADRDTRASSWGGQLFADHWWQDSVRLGLP